MHSVRAGNTRLSPSSVATFVYCTTVAYGVVMGPKSVVIFAREAAPLISLLGLGLALLLQALFVRLAERFPLLTLFQWPIRMFGPLGYIPVAIVILYLMVLLVAHTYLFATLLHLVVLIRTPMPVIIVFVFALSLFGAFQGIEAMSRFFLLIVYLELLALPPLLLEGPRVFTWTHFLPWLPLDGSTWLLGPLVALSGFLGFAHAPLTLLPQVQAGGKILRPSLLGLALAGFLIWAFTFGVLGTFGPDVARLLPFPTFEYSQVIELPRILVFISRYSLIFLAIWILAISQLAMFELYIIAMGVQQVLGLRHHRGPLVVATLVATIAAAVIPNPVMGQQVVGAISSVGVALATVLVPLLGLLVLLMRRRADKVAKDSQIAPFGRGS
ncbi:MAG: GerAB/ArcD/ProY family transporter [Symbiobacteriia bacterium]